MSESAQVTYRYLLRRSRRSRSALSFVLKSVAAAGCLLSGIVSTLIAADEVTSAEPAALPQLLKIEWQLGADLPQGFQDSDGGVIHDQLITVGGFCSGGLDEDNRRKPGRYPRGFLKKAWSLTLSDQDSGWREIPEFPGAARQAISAAIVDDEMYVWGGFSYTSPYCYADGWRLSREGNQWVWTALPNFPWPVNSAALCTVGTKIYAFGGSDYNAEAFFTDTDRDGGRPRLGARLLMLETDDLQAGWQELPSCPGTPRWVHNMAVVDGRLYVIGGATGNTVRDGTSYGYCTVVDNWRYSPETQKWTRLSDTPVASGNFPRSTNNVFRNRYLVLPGGYQYSYVLNPDGSIRESFGEVHSANPKSGLRNDVFVYDTHTDTFGTADRLPIDNNLPMTVIHDNRIYLLGGETGGGEIDGQYYGHHPDLLLIGTVKEVSAFK